MHMQTRHSLHCMQESQEVSRPLLTARDVQDVLHIDRSTVYRMAEDGRLPAIRVGRSWRFPADGIQALLGPPVPQAPGPHGESAEATEPVEDEDAGGDARPGLDTAAARAVVEVAADLLGVMMVVTDMHGRPITDVENPCPWFTEHASDPEVLAGCIAEWRDLADHPDLSPRFQQGAQGFQCARAFVRSGSRLVGMVLAGGVSLHDDASVDPDLHHLDEAGRVRVLSTLPRIAAAISTQPSRRAAGPTKEDT